MLIVLAMLYNSYYKNGEIYSLLNQTAVSFNTTVNHIAYMIPKKATVSCIM